jgi:hypothetical protein
MIAAILWNKTGSMPSNLAERLPVFLALRAENRDA